ncbi:hypothetical protein WA588_005702 [Blastocystis sp. NMH]
MKTVYKLFSVCLFVCILNVALCEESVEVNVSNTPSEPSMESKYEAIMTQMKQKLATAEKEVKEVSSKFESYKKSQEAKLKGVQNKLKEENEELRKFIKSQEKQIASLKMKIVELKESQKDIDLLQLMVDVTEQKILPASEKLLAQAKEFGRRGEKYAAQQWARLQHFLRTDATCQKLKATTQQSLQQARTLAATQWAKVSPKVSEVYGKAAQLAAPYYVKARAAVAPTLQQGRAMGLRVVQQGVSWSQRAMMQVCAWSRSAFAHAVAVLEAVYVWLQKTCAEKADFLFYCLLVVIGHCVVSLLLCVAMQLVCILLCPLRWLCPCCRRKCSCGACCH